MTLYTPSNILSSAVLASLLGWSAAAGAATPNPGADAANLVKTRLAAKDCGEAVTELKAGLKQGYREVVLLAAAMHDRGFCVKRDWNRAADFYAQAYQAGMKEAADFLAAGFAAPENGPDVAAALWWASRGRGYAAKGCTVSPAAADDPDRFVAELATWPQSRRAACNYVAGVLSTIVAEVKYPATAQNYLIEGDIHLRFLPGVPRIDLRMENVSELDPLERRPNGLMRDRSLKKLSADFEKMIDDISKRALQRYPQPEGIPADTVVELSYRFRFDA
ncbi:hypothetical protein ACI48D_18335 [Massilia sp. LXY-6]|uniref:hypothetical protein n=1 Tax=Massilia sp. LXY-6 TaxID=3379823 RepID=UPI003EE0299E